MKPQFISYPKSGRTWIRYALIQLEAGRNIAFHHDGFEFNDGALPPHDFSVADRLARYDGAKVIYLSRDPRDVMCSLYTQVTGRFDDFFGYRGTLSDFLRHDYFGAHNLARFRAMWDEIAQRRQVYTLSYEEMSTDPAETLMRLTQMLERPRTRAQIAEAVAASSLPAMRAVEQSGTFDQPWLRPRLGHAKVREGKVGGFRAQLEPNDIAYLNGVFALEA